MQRRQQKLKELVEELNLLFIPSAINRKIVLDVQIYETIPDSLMGDPFRLRQILSNLIGNSIKFTRDGKINVELKKIDTYQGEGIKIEFLVRDTGIGIKQDKINELFKSFSQADTSTTRKYGGTGLGLAICKSLVEKMRGEIWVESKETEDTRFYFTCILGKSEDAEEEEEGKDNFPEVREFLMTRAKQNLIKPLIVEDDEISRLVIKRFSEKMLSGWNG